MAKKVYGVKVGRIPGVYNDWSEVQKQITGFSGAIFKGFSSEAEAKAFVYGTSETDSNENNVSKEILSSKTDEDFKEDISIYVDGSFLNEKIGFGIVVVKNNEVIMKDCGRFIGRVEDNSQRNVAGEIYAMIRAVQLIRANEFNNVCFCHDYEGICKWISGEWKAKNSLTQRYVEYFKEHMNVNFKFKHVKAHTGNIFNEEADRLAKLGTIL